MTEYYRGWEDALDVVLELHDWRKVESIQKNLRENRIKLLEGGPFSNQDLRRVP